jgi:hypothetical protein
MHSKFTKCWFREILGNQHSSNSKLPTGGVYSDKMNNPSGWERFIYLRSEIKGQHDIMNHRMSWFAATQSLLFGAYASSACNKQILWFSMKLLPMVGIMLCILMIPAVISAHERIQSLRTRLKIIARPFAHVYPMNPDCYHNIAQLYPCCAPIIFLISWGIVVYKNFLTKC